MSKNIVSKAFSKYKEMSLPAKAAIWFALCSILQKGISFITVPIFTRLLSAEQYGTYSLYLSWLQIFTIITSLYLYYGVFNNGMNKYDEDRDTYISSMQGLTLTITLIVMVVFFLSYNYLESFIGLPPLLLGLMLVEMALTPALSFWSGRQRFEYKYKALVVLTLLKSIANPVLGIIAVNFSAEKDVARIVSIVVVEVLFCAPIMVQQFRKGKMWYHKNYWNYALRLAIPLLPHYLSGMILNQGDRIMISKMVGVSEVAYYSVAYSVGMLVQIFTNAINNSFTPWVYQRIKSDNYKNIPDTVNFLLCFISLLCFFVMMISPELVILFGTDGYSSAAYVIPPVAASVYFIYLYNVLAIPQFYFERTQFLMVSSIIAAIVNIGLNYIFIRLFGYIAAGYTTLACYVIYSIGHYLVSKQVMEKYIPGKKLYDFRLILIVSLIVILLGTFSNLLFEYRIVRLLILMGCTMMFLVRRKEIVSKIRLINSK